MVDGGRHGGSLRHSRGYHPLVPCGRARRDGAMLLPFPRGGDGGGKSGAYLAKEFQDSHRQRLDLANRYRSVADGGGVKIH